MTTEQPLALKLTQDSTRIIERLRRTPMPLKDVIPHMQAMGDELRRLHDLLGKANALARIRAERIAELEQAQRDDTHADTALLRQALEALEACLGWPEVIEKLKERLK